MLIAEKSITYNLHNLVRIVASKSCLCKITPNSSFSVFLLGNIQKCDSRLIGIHNDNNVCIFKIDLFKIFSSESICDYLHVIPLNRDAVGL